MIVLSVTPGELILVMLVLVAIAIYALMWAIARHR
jgi:hypothetical protein